MIKKGSCQLKRTGRIKSKPKTESEKLQQKEDIEKMYELFEEHWNTKPRRCESCRSILTGENKTTYHHHLLPKGMKKYEHLKLEVDNLMMLCENCHCSHEHGYSTPAIQTETEWAHKRFNI